MSALGGIHTPHPAYTGGSSGTLTAAPFSTLGWSIGRNAGGYRCYGLSGSIRHVGRRSDNLAGRLNGAGRNSRAYSHGFGDRIQDAESLRAPGPLCASAFRRAFPRLLFPRSACLL